MRSLKVVLFFAQSANFYFPISLQNIHPCWPPVRTGHTSSGRMIITTWRSDIIIIVSPTTGLLPAVCSLLIEPVNDNICQAQTLKSGTFLYVFEARTFPVIYSQKPVNDMSGTSPVYERGIKSFLGGVHIFWYPFLNRASQAQTLKSRPFLYVCWSKNIYVIFWAALWCWDPIACTTWGCNRYDEREQRLPGSSCWEAWFKCLCRLESTSRLWPCRTPTAMGIVKLNMFRYVQSIDTN